MIFDIYGKQIDGKLQFDLPYHEFDVNLDKVGLKRIIIEWRTREKFFGVVKSSLVDLGPENTRQQLYAFVKHATTTTTDIEISDPTFYDIQINQLEVATIDIQSMFQTPIPDITNIYLQLITVSQ